MKIRTLILCGIFFAMGGLSNEAMAKKIKQAPMKAEKKMTLYQRLGGKVAIEKVVEDFVNRAASDSRIARFFVPTTQDPKRVAHLRKMLVDQICQGSGGPCQYKGKNMKDAHANMGVQDADFNALVEDLVASLNQFRVPDKEKNELVAVLAPMKKDIVQPGKDRDTASDPVPAPAPN